MTATELGAGLQVRADNPLAGLEGRAALLRRLGETLAAAPGIFARFHTPRPSGLVDGLVEQLEDDALPARTILIALLRHLGPIWPGGRRWTASISAIAGATPASAAPTRPPG